MLWTILVASGLLLVGVVLRAKVRLLQRWFVPASVIGGVFGLALVQAMQRWTPTVVANEVEGVVDSLRSWPGLLIAVVFAGLLLERPSRSLTASFRGAALAGIAVWIIVLGEIVIGVIATATILRGFDGIPIVFGQLIEAGFAGGHGTATALGVIHREVVDFPEGHDLGMFMATVGLIFSVVSGIALVNIGVRRGWTRSGEVDVRLLTGLEARRDPQPMALARVRSEVIDPLVFQIVIMAMAMLVGVALQRAVMAIPLLLHAEESLKPLGNLPLFLFTLIGGLLVRQLMTATGTSDLIDPESIKRLVGVAMEFLIVAAVASLRVETVAAFFWPLMLLMTLGFAWALFCLTGLSRLLLPEAYWFELGILNYGMSTGTTAQGMMLLRIVDKDLESGAAEDYALAAPLSAPFVGGGVVTMSMPILLVKMGAWPVAVALSVIAVGLYAVGRRLRRGADVSR